MSTLLFVGLGNPGPTYSHTRHNIGFDAVDFYLKNHTPSQSKKFKGEFFELNQESHKVFFLKPQTFMNLSGESVQAAVHFYKLEPAEQVIVLHDDLDFELGQIKLRLDGGTAGNNGIQSIIELLGTDKFMRMRMGIGRPKNQTPSKDYVLQKFSKDEKPTVDTVLKRTCEIIDEVIKNGFKKAMNKFNGEKVWNAES